MFKLRVHAGVENSDATDVMPINLNDVLVDLVQGGRLVGRSVGLSCACWFVVEWNRVEDYLIYAKHDSRQSKEG